MPDVRGRQRVPCSPQPCKKGVRTTWREYISWKTSQQRPACYCSVCKHRRITGDYPGLEKIPHSQPTSQKLLEKEDRVESRSCSSKAPHTPDGEPISFPSVGDHRCHRALGPGQSQGPRPPDPCFNPRVSPGGLGQAQTRPPPARPAGKSLQAPVARAGPPDTCRQQKEPKPLVPLPRVTLPSSDFVCKASPWPGRSRQKMQSYYVPGRTERWVSLNTPNLSTLRPAVALGRGQHGVGGWTLPARVSGAPRI